jgi:hypothetical protein
VNFLTTQELLSLPNPSWLIRHILPETGLNLLFGPTQQGKSFVALDWALSISAGIPWLGEYPVKQGHVVYIAAEGGQGIKKRVAAWMAHKRVEKLPNITWFLEPLNLREEDVVGTFMEKLRTRTLPVKEKGAPSHFTTEAIYHEDGSITPVPYMSIRLIVIDTLSRCFGGEDENMSSTMTAFIGAVEQFCLEHGAAVLIIHHTNAGGLRERGHSSLKGAVDASFHCTAVIEQGQTPTSILLENNKQKDEKGESDIHLHPIRLTLPMLPRDEEGEYLTSLVLERGEQDGLETGRDVVMSALKQAGKGMNTHVLEKAGIAADVSKRIIRKVLATGIKDGTILVKKGMNNSLIYRLPKTWG